MIRIADKMHGHSTNRVKLLSVQQDKPSRFCFPLILKHQPMRSCTHRYTRGFIPYFKQRPLFPTPPHHSCSHFEFHLLYNYMWSFILIPALKMVVSYLMALGTGLAYSHYGRLNL
jgi:hypothetical protein